MQAKQSVRSGDAGDVDWAEKVKQDVINAALAEHGIVNN